MTPVKRAEEGEHHAGVERRGCLPAMPRGKMPPEKEKKKEKKSWRCHTMRRGLLDLLLLQPLSRHRGKTPLLSSHLRSCPSQSDRLSARPLARKLEVGVEDQPEKKIKKEGSSLPLAAVVPLNFRL